MPEKPILPSQGEPSQQRGAGREPAGTWLRLALVCCGVFIGWQLWRANSFLAALQHDTRQHQFWLLCHRGGTEAERARAFLALVEAGNDEWRSAAMEHLPLRGSLLDQSDLRRTNFEGSDLSRASFTRAQLQHATLQLVDLSDARFEDAEMAGASLMKSVLDRTDFQQAKMQGVSLQQTRGSQANFLVADLSEADLLMAELPEANFAGASLRGARLRSAILRGATLTLTDLTDANLSNIDLTDSNWWRARGLTASQLEELTALFPPSPDAPAPLIQDFHDWRQSTE